MSRKPTFAAGALALAALTFGSGYWIGTLQRPASIGRAKTGVAPPPEGVGAELYAAMIKPDPLERSAELGRILQPLGPEALEVVRGAYDSVLLDVGDAELVLLAEWWSRFDPAAAFDWARQSRIGWHPAVLSAVVRAWAREDPEAASEAVRSIRDPRLRGASFVALVRGWEESGRGGLVDYLASQPMSEELAQAIEALARGKVLREGPDAAIAWAEALPDDEPPGELKVNAYRRVAGAIVQLDPERAAAWAARQVGGSQSGLLGRVAMAWAERDGEATMRWLSTLPESGERTYAVQEAYRTWSGRDERAASEWLRAAQLAPWLDPAVSTFALRRGRENPREGLSWADRLVDPARRDRTVAGIVWIWLHASPEEAQAWIDQAELSDGAKAYLERARAAADRRNARSAPAASPGRAPEEDEGAPEPVDAVAR